MIASPGRDLPNQPDQRLRIRLDALGAAGAGVAAGCGCAGAAAAGLASHLTVQLVLVAGATGLVVSLIILIFFCC